MNYHYVTYDKFSNARKCYLSTVMKIVKAKFYPEAVEDANWREAMQKKLKL